MPKNYAVPDANFINELESKNGHEKDQDLTMKDLTTYNEAQHCFFCTHINTKSLQENEIFYNLMKLYTDNSQSVCKDAIYNMMLQYYDNFIKEHLDGKCLSIHEIETHFSLHTSFATDEILTQINITKGVRRHIMNQLAKLDDEGNVKINDGNVKMLLVLNKELRTLQQMKDELPNHIGYDNTLSY